MIKRQQTLVYLRVIAQRVEQVFLTVGFDFQRKSQQLTQLAGRKPFVRKPEQVLLWQINDDPSSILAKGHSDIGQLY